MRRFLFQFFMFCLLQVVIGVAVLRSAQQHFSKGYLAALEDKIDLLESDGPPRILFVGGSSVAFGVDSEQFEALERRPVNLGLHAGLGLDFCATLVESHVRSGDLVVLMPEYGNLVAREKPHATLHRSLLRQCPRAARYLDDPWPSPKAFLDQRAIPELACWAQTGIRRLPRNISDEVLTKLGLISGPERRLYSRASFNGNGDMIGHHGMPRRGQPENQPLAALDCDKLADSIDRLNRCVAVCRRRGAYVVFAHPPLPEPKYRASVDTVREITAALESRLSCPVITHYDSAVFPLDLFFDQAGHLTEAGKRERTKVLIDGLSRHEMAIARTTKLARAYR